MTRCMLITPSGLKENKTADNMSRCLLLLVVLVLGMPEGMAQARPASLHIHRVAGPPKLEHFLDGPWRATGIHVADFRQYEPGDGVPASLETSAYLSYDEKNLYVIFVCQDEPGQVRARLSRREDISGDDQVAVYLDTFHDRQRAYVFATNPLGIQRDGIITEGQGRDFSFDTLWYSEGRLTDDGFVVWMAIPFRSLRFSNAPAQTWGIALGRFILRRNEESYWPLITKRVEGFVPQFAVLEGLDHISPGRNVQLIPYGIFARARFLDTQGPAFRTKNDMRAGLDAKLVLRDALTLDIAVNPDFSQVESDEPQVTINQRFEVFFPEKRPFFIENAGFFQTPINLFFSRRIADPQAGVRLTGKVSRWAIGALAIDDRAPGRRVPESSALHSRRAGIGLLRVKREFAEQSSLGVLVTSRDFASSSNRVVSLDTRLKLNPNWILTGQLAQSITRQLEGRRLAGWGSFLELKHDGKHFDYVGRYTDFSPDFRAPLGFVRRVDIRQSEHSAKYKWWPDSRPVLEFGPTMVTLINWDRHGRVQDWLVDANFELELTGQTELEVARSEAFELFQNQGFRKNSTSISFSTEWLKWLSMSASYMWGTNVNFDPTPGLGPFLAKEVEGQTQLTLRPTPRVRFDQTYIYNRLGTHRNSQTVFNNHIARWKLNYQFTRALSLRAILDYEAVLPNTSLVDLDYEKRFTTDLLLTYLVNPGTVVYVGYTDGYENLALVPDSPARLRRTISLFGSTGRQLFIKVSYLLRF